MSKDDMPHTGDPYAHVDQNRAELAALHSDQFAGNNTSLNWPDGWHGLISEVCAYAEQHQIPVRWAQIKEKFGCLRMYYDGGPVRAYLHVAGRVTSFEQEADGARAIPGFHERVKEAEAESLRTCCLCGTSAPIAQVKQRNLNEWRLTACDACAPLIRARHNSV